MDLPFPAWFDALDRRLVNDAITAASPPSVPLQNKPGDPLVAFGNYPGSFQTDTAAVAAVLQVFKVVVSRWRQHPEHATDQATIDALLNVLIVEWADARPTPQSPLADFADAVRRELRATPWWPIDATDPGPNTIGQQLGALLFRANWSQDQLAEEMGIDRTNLQDHLSGKTEPRGKTLDEYNRVFSARLNEPVKLHR